LQKSQPPIGTDEVGCAEPPPDGTTNTTKAGPTQVYPNDEATWGVLGTARSDATGRFRLPYASPGSSVLAVDAPATSVYGSCVSPACRSLPASRRRPGSLIVPHKWGAGSRARPCSA